MAVLTHDGVKAALASVVDRARPAAPFSHDPSGDQSSNSFLFGLGYGPHAVAHVEVQVEGHLSRITQRLDLTSNLHAAAHIRATSRVFELLSFDNAATWVRRTSSSHNGHDPRSRPFRCGRPSAHHMRSETPGADERASERLYALCTIGSSLARETLPAFKFALGNTLFHQDLLVIRKVPRSKLAYYALPSQRAHQPSLDRRPARRRARQYAWRVHSGAMRRDATLARI
jgi:hypothetical protein